MNKTFNIFLFLFSTLGLMNSCSRTSLHPQEYVRWVDNQNNGCLVSQEIGSYIFQLQFRPKEYMALIQSGKEAMTHNELDSLSMKFSGLSYFVLKMRDKFSSEFLYANVTSDEEYHLRNTYFSDAMSADLYLIEGADTLHPALFHFEQNYGAAPYNTVVFAFEKERMDDDFQIIYDDFVLGTGRVIFSFKQDNLRNVPEIITAES